MNCKRGKSSCSSSNSNSNSCSGTTRNCSSAGDVNVMMKEVMVDTADDESLVSDSTVDDGDVDINDDFMIEYRREMIEMAPYISKEK